MEKIINIVTEVTGVKQEDIIAKRGSIDVQEARMLFFMLARDAGYSDYDVARYINRTQVSVWKTRKYAEEYAQLNRSFNVKVVKALSKLYLSNDIAENSI